MPRYKQFQPILVSTFETTQWAHPVHNHNHYELIFIKQGAGQHYVGGVPIAYQKGSVFLLGPDDEHYFDIETSTRFIYVKFTDPYAHSEDMGGMQHLEYLIKSRETHLAGFSLAAGGAHAVGDTRTPHDAHAVELLFDIMLTLSKDILLNEALIWSQVLVLATLLQRNMPAFKPVSGDSRDMQAVYCYIHKYIYEPERLKAEAMAQHFHMSPGYMGPYFKRNAGTTLREYIGQYRSSLIRQRLDSGNYSLKQIAADFGLTDESHVRKSLRQTAGNRPFGQAAGNSRFGQTAGNSPFGQEG
jgi:AraC family L-rhamnose operon regulatory protein RhaS